MTVKRSEMGLRTGCQRRPGNSRSTFGVQFNFVIVELVLDSRTEIQNNGIFLQKVVVHRYVLLLQSSPQRSRTAKLYQYAQQRSFILCSTSLLSWSLALPSRELPLISVGTPRNPALSATEAHQDLFLTASQLGTYHINPRAQLLFVENCGRDECGNAEVLRLRKLRNRFRCCTRTSVLYVLW